ncbi:MAG TPA: YDG domain-containing protein [Syntrophobacteraceae bacterium]|nr:YDG domain-containing protein [Syntrophobacteraceae bacterium]
MSTREKWGLRWVAAILRRLMLFACRCLLACVLAVCIFVLAVSPPLWANPTGGKVTAGSATIAQKPKVTTIDQTTEDAIINWNGFSIASGELTQFIQPNSGAITLNRVIQNDPSQIFGQLKANGQVWLVNPNGVFFGPNAKVDVAGILVTTADIKNNDFMAGRYNFSIPSPNSKASVTNQGTISIKDAGLAGLVAPHVRNDGIIQARLGQVVLGGTPTFTLDFNGDGLIKFQATSKVVQSDPNNPLVANTGTIKADGGTVLVTANAAAGVVNEAINVGGLVEARSASMKDGAIVLNGGDSGVVDVAGTLDASGTSAGQTGGSIKVLGEKVALDDGARLDASGDAGGGQVLVGGNFHGSGPEKNATSVYVAKNAEIDADALTRGNGGKVAVYSTGLTDFNGTIYARGGRKSGDGGIVEVSGQTVNDNGLAWLTAPKGRTGTLFLDPLNFTISPGGNETGAQVSTQLASANVYIDASSTITVDDLVNPIQWSNSNILTLKAGGTINVDSTINGLYNGGSGIVRLNAPTIAESALGVIAANGLGLEATAATLNGTNTVNTLAANVIDGLTYTNTRGFTVGTVAADLEPGHGALSSLSGITTNGNAVNLTAQTGDLTVGNAITTTPTTPNTAGGGISLTATAGNVNIQNSVDARGSGTGVSGDVSLTARSGGISDAGTAGGIYANWLDLIAGREIDLTNGANNVLSLQANATGNISYAQSAGFSVRRLISGGDILLSSGGLVSQPGRSAISAVGLDLEGTGSYHLLDPSGLNAITTLAGNVGGDVYYTQNGGFDIGTVGNRVGLTSGGNIVLSSGGAVTQSQSIVAAGLDLQGNGSFDFNNPTKTNSVATLAGDMEGNVTYAQSGVLVIGTVVDTGITGNGNVVVSSGATGAKGGLELATGSFIDTSGSVTLATSGAFTNNAGSSAIVAPSWLIYSAAPGKDTFDGIIPAFVQYNAPYFTSNGIPTPPVAAGNGFLYSYAPVLNASLTGTVSKVYDTTNTATLTAANFADVNGTLTGVIAGDTVTLIAVHPSLTGAYSDPNAGTHKLVTDTLTGFDIRASTVISGTTVIAYGYSLGTASGNVGTITPAPLTISSVRDTKVYDATTAATGAIPRVIGLLGTDSVTGLSEVFASKNAGIWQMLVNGYTINDGNSGKNYTVTINDTARGTIDPAKLTISSVSDTKVYDATTAAPGAIPTVIGLLGGDTVTGLSEVFASKNAGTRRMMVNGYAINDGNGGKNYTVTIKDNARGTIDKAPLVIDANNAGREFGEVNPVFTASFSGFKLNDNASVVSGLQISTNANQNSQPGQYLIIPYGATAENYRIKFVDGTLTVTPSPLGPVLHSTTPTPPPYYASASTAEISPLGWSLIPWRDASFGGAVSDAELLFANDGNLELWSVLGQ